MPPVVTALYAALNAILNIALAYRVTRVRNTAGVSIGEGENQALLLAIRAHANNAEYLPLAIVMMLLAELCGGSPMWLHVIGGSLLIARVFHVIGLPRPSPNFFRWTGVALTFAGIVATSGYVLYLRFTLDKL